MELTNSELKLIRDIPKRRQADKRSAWLSLLVLPICAYVFIDGGDLAPVTGVAVGLVLGNFFRVVFEDRPVDKVVALLERYANNDVETIVGKRR